jgi:UDP-N-acetylglucosamine pyrophosphorylase
VLSDSQLIGGDLRLDAPEITLQGRHASPIATAASMGKAEGDFGPFEEKMRKEGLSDAAIDAFRHNYEQLIAGVTGLVGEDTIEAIDELPRLEDIDASKDVDLQKLLSQTAVLKLNGGLGTSMGLEKAKSLLEVRDGKTFLDLIAEQVEHTRTTIGAKVRFVLMNSFSTSDDTKAHLRKKHAALVDEPDSELVQNKSPKIDAKTLKPAEYPDHPDMEWCPPGHGDIYPSLLGSGLLERLRGAGINYVFVSNSDNLGATLDLDILAYFAQSGNAFLMEVAKRTAADKKGGHLTRRKSDGRLLLRESAMVSDEDKSSFEDISKHKFFNTNNLWVNLDKLQDTLDQEGGLLKLPLIKNKKTVNPRDSDSAPVFQLETAMGSAIECFESAGAIVVPRTRFAPVKTCNDLFVLRSDAYKVTEASTLELVKESAPAVKLDDKHYKLVDKMEALTLRAPSLVDATSLTVKGPVKFVPGVTIKGDVTFINDTGKPIAMKEGTYQDQTVDLKPSSTPEPQTGGLQPAYA